MTWLGVLGKLLISVGCGVLLFVAWTLWGTGIYTSQQQARLAHEYGLTPTGGAGAKAAGDPGRSGPSPSFSPAPGDPVFRLEIPKIGLDMMVVEGVGEQELELGPGHYPACAASRGGGLCTKWPAVWPGEEGRVIVSGHRTTYLHPFLDLDEVEAGDRIEIEALWGKFSYRVTREEIVPPDSSSVVVQRPRPELVLTTCHPPYSASSRLVVFARPVGA